MAEFLSIIKAAESLLATLNFFSDGQQSKPLPIHSVLCLLENKDNSEMLTEKRWMLTEMQSIKAVCKVITYEPFLAELLLC